MTRALPFTEISLANEIRADIDPRDADKAAAEIARYLTLPSHHQSALGE